MSGVESRGRVARRWPGRTVLSFRTDDLVAREGLLTNEVIVLGDWHAPLVRATFERHGDHWCVRGPLWWSLGRFVAKPRLTAELVIALDELGIVLGRTPRRASEPTTF